MGVAATWSCDPDAANKLSFPLPKEAPQKNLALIGHAVLEKNMFEIVNGDGRMPYHEYPISSPMSLWLRKLKSQKIYFHFRIPAEKS